MEICLILLGAAACGREARPEKMSFPPTPVLTISSTWGVVTSPLLRLREDSSNKAEILSWIRMKTVVEVIAKSDKEDTIEDQTAYWYRINYQGLKGWVFGFYIKIFDSLQDARAFADTLQ